MGVAGGGEGGGLRRERGAKGGRFGVRGGWKRVGRVEEATLVVTGDGRPRWGLGVAVGRAANMATGRAFGGAVEIVNVSAGEWNHGSKHVSWFISVFFVLFCFSFFIFNLDP